MMGLLVWAFSPAGVSGCNLIYRGLRLPHLGLLLAQVNQAALSTRTMCVIT